MNDAKGFGKAAEATEMTAVSKSVFNSHSVV